MGGRRPRGRGDVVFRRVAETWLLYDPRTQLIHELNLTAALVWSFCTGEHTVEEIRREVEAAFQDPSAEGGDPVARALERFSEEALLEDGGEGPPPGKA